MVTAVQRFQTTDGSVFADPKEAKAHEVRLLKQPEVTAFLDDFFPKKEGTRQGPARSIAQRAIFLWIADKQPV